MSGEQVTLMVAGKSLIFVRGQTRVQGCRPPFVPVPRPGPCKGWKEMRRRLESDPAERARVRQGRIDDARAKADVLAELEELDINQTDVPVIGRRLAPLLRRAHLDQDRKIAELVQVAQSGDRRKLATGLRQAARRFGLRRIDGGARRVAFNPRDHRPLTGSRPPRVGQMVNIVRPGYDFLWETVGDRPARLDKTFIEED